MERRVKLLEQDIRKVREKLDGVRADTQYLKGRFEDMPTKDWMNTRLLAYFSIFATIGVTVIGFMIRFLPSL